MQRRFIFMANDYEYHFTVSLHEKLKEKLWAGIHTKVMNDILEVTIARKEFDEPFKMYFNNFAEKIFNGWSSDQAVYEIVGKYRKFIINKYFVDPNCPKHIEEDEQLV